MGLNYIYTMKGLSKSYSQNRSVLKDIWLSFLPGAKIGVLGLNGAGKSTILRIMAGEISEFEGEAFPARGVSVGYLSQEPQLDPSKNVAGNVNEGVEAARSLLKRYDEVVASLSSGLVSPEMDEALEEQGELQNKIDAVGAWDLMPAWTWRWMRFGCHLVLRMWVSFPVVSDDVWRCVDCYCSRLICCYLMSRQII